MLALRNDMTCYRNCTRVREVSQRAEIDVTAIQISASLGPWGDDDYCSVKYTDPSTHNTHINGMCFTAEGKEIACWRPDKGWITEDFAKNPVARIKGWIELNTFCLNKAIHIEGCDALMMLRAATDTYAAIEQITAKFGVHWDPQMLRLFEGMRDTCKRISDSLIVDPNIPDDQFKVSKQIGDRTTQDGRSIRNIASTSEMLSKSVDKDSDAIQLPDWLNLDNISIMLEAIAFGAAFCGPAGLAVAVYIEAIVAVIQAVQFLIPVINGVIKWLRHIF